LIFGSDLWGAAAGQLFSHILKIIVGLILLSAVNSAINGLISLQYLMASDEELPRVFRKVNTFGVPLLPLVIASVIPVILILIVKKIILLANLYAIGFVGAIATNLGATSTDSNLPFRKRERIFMFCTFLIMTAIEITLFIQKPDARYFALVILILGLSLKQLAKVKRKKIYPLLPEVSILGQEDKKGAILCVVKRFGRAVRRAVEESNRSKTPLNIVFVREQRVISEKDLKRTGANDLQAKRVFDYVYAHGDPHLIHYYYSVTDSFVNIAVAYAERLEASRIIVDAPISKILTLLKGNYVRILHKKLPENIPLTTIHK